MDQDSQLAKGARRRSEAHRDRGAEFAGRRQVIKGLFGLPAVVTLASGGTAAAVSVLNCATNSPPSDGDTLFVEYDGEDPQRDLGDNLFDNGQDTAVRLKTGYPVNPSSNNIQYVDPDGGDIGNEVPVVASCYASFAATG